MLFILYWFSSLPTGHKAEITQLAAVTWDGKFAFNQYVLPEGHISIKASEITGLTIGKVNGKRELLHNGKAVESHPIGEVLLNFMEWLEDCRGINTNQFSPLYCLSVLNMPPWKRS